MPGIGSRSTAGTTQRVLGAKGWTDVFEYFGGYWHEPHEEQERIDYYRSLGWECEVLWGYDTVNWVLSHQELVTDDEHQAAWRVARMNNESRKES